MIHPDRVASGADQFFTSALWYAWGMHDSGTFKGITWDMPFDFAKNVAEIATEFLMGKTTHMPSIMDMWEKFAEWYGIERVPYAVR